jgi:magnesium transporter
MSESQESKDSLSESLQQVITLLDKHKLVEDLVHRQSMHNHDLVESLVHKQNLQELQKKLDQLHLSLIHISEPTRQVH